jgi:hypothetical protein
VVNWSGEGGSRRSLLACAAATLVVAVLLAVSGGFRFTVGGLRVSARSPMAPAIAALAMLAAWAWLASRRHEAESDLAAFWSGLDRSAWTIVAGLAAVSAGMAMAFGTFTAAGADASGYLSQAAMWATGRLGLSDRLPLMAGWPPDAGMSAPLGWNASLERGWQVPTYGPGLPLLMAMPHAMGGPLAACLVVAVSAAIAVIATGSIAVRLAGRPAAIVAAVTLATCPAFIFQSVQPMSDVPVTAAWMVCWALAIRSGDGSRHPPSPGFGGTGTANVLPAGIACAVAVLIRPNLAPLAIVPLVFVLRTANRERRIAEGLGFAIPVALSGLFLAWLQWHWYGSPFRSGYGTVEQLYSFTLVGTNATRYATWLISTSPILLLALAGVWIRREAATWALAAFAALNAAAYLVYFAFNEWSYLRFLMPALAIASVFTGVAVAALVERVGVSGHAGVLLAAALVTAGVGVARARSLGSFRLADAHRRVLQMDRYLDSALPPQAVVIAGEQSGAVRFDTGRAIIRWEAASPDDLAQVLAVLEGSGRPVWVVLDVWEEPLVRAKFSGLDAAALDWPPVVDAGDANRTRAWSISDRGRYLKGARLVTDRLR